MAVRLKHFNVTMVMFKTDGSSTMNHFEDRYPFDEDGKHGGLPVASHKEFMRPHDVECDETPHADPRDNSTYDNAYCEVSQQIFNLGYRVVWPDVFMDKKGSKVSVSGGNSNFNFPNVYTFISLSVLGSGWGRRSSVFAGKLLAKRKHHFYTGNNGPPDWRLRPCLRPHLQVSVRTL